MTYHSIFDQLKSTMSPKRHKCFISYHHSDQKEVEDFIKLYEQENHIFISRALGTEMDPTIIDSDDPDYVMRKIRELYLRDSTVTIVMIGKCTWARRYVDWEIQASLSMREESLPNGLLAITLPSASTLFPPVKLPERLSLNLTPPPSKTIIPKLGCYARRIGYPFHPLIGGARVLSNAIEDSFNSRYTMAHLINNPSERFRNNRPCPVKREIFPWHL